MATRKALGLFKRPVAGPSYEAPATIEASLVSLNTQSQIATSREPVSAIAELAHGSPRFKDEYGLQVLKAPSNPAVDIIFVHGLTGSQISTWTADGTNEPWPSSLLSTDLSNARISAYGYDADVVHWLGPAGQNRIRQHAKNLLASVADMWLEYDTEELPIIFVAHSLGGLVCANALTVATNSERHQQVILEHTKGIIFLGTPHRGSDLASWATIAGNMVKLVKRTNTDIVAVLEPNSEVLEIINQEFHTMLRSRQQNRKPEIRIICFAEELPVTRAGKTFMVVPHKSALLEAYEGQTLHADHITMTKFEQRSSDYKKIALCLKRWIRDLQNQSTNANMLLSISSNERSRSTSPTKPRFRQAQHTLSGHSPIFFAPAAPINLTGHTIGRVEELKRLHSALTGQQNSLQNFALRGIPGIGKTQLVLTFIEEAVANSTVRFVFYIRADNLASFLEDYQEMYHIISCVEAERNENNENPFPLPRVVPERAALDETVAQKMKKILEDRTLDRSERWLLVLEDVEPSGFANIRPYLPRYTSSGMILTVSQSARVRVQAGASHESGTMIDLESLSLEAATELFLQTFWVFGSPIPEDIQKTAGSIVDCLGCHPYAVLQLALFASEKGYDIHQTAKLLEGSRSINFVTWHANATQHRYSSLFDLFNKSQIISSLTGMRLEILRILSFLHGECIPKEILYAIASGLDCQDTPLIRVLEAKQFQADGIESALHELSLTLLVVHSERNERHHNLKMNKALQMVLRYGPRDSKGITYLFDGLAHALTLAMSACDERHPHNWEYLTNVVRNTRILEGHAKGYSYTSNRGDVVPRALRRHVIRLALVQGEFDRADISHFAADVDKIRKSPDVEDQHDLAAILRDQGRFAEAKEILTRAIAVCPLTSLSHKKASGAYLLLAMLEVEDNRLEEGEKLVKEVMRFVTGNGTSNEDCYIATESKVMLGQIRLRRDEYTQADKLFMEALETRTAVLGEQHCDTLFVRRYSALVPGYRRFHPDTLKAFEILVFALKQILGQYHPDTLQAQGDLINVYTSVGKYLEAKQVADEMIELTSRHLRPNHWLTLTAKLNLGNVFIISGRHEEAQRLMKPLADAVLNECGPRSLTHLEYQTNMFHFEFKHRGIESAERLNGLIQEFISVRGEKSSSVQELYYLRVYICIMQEKFDEAEQIARQILDNASQKNDPQELDIAMYQGFVAFTLRYNKKFEEAESFLWRSIKLIEKNLPKDHPRVLEIYSALSDVYCDQGNQVLRKEFASQAYNGLSRWFGKIHIAVVEALETLAAIHIQLRDTDEAIKLLEDLISRRSILREEGYSEMLEHYASLAMLHTAQNNHTEAESVLRRCLLRQKEENMDPVAIAPTEFALAKSLAAQDRIADAKQVVFNIIESLTGSETSVHAIKQQAVHDFVEYCMTENDADGSSLIELTLRCFNERRDALGEDHKDTLATMTLLAKVVDKFSSEESGDVWSKLLTIQRQVPNIDQVVIARTMCEVAYQKAEKADWNGAAELLTEAIASLTIKLGPKDKEVTDCQGALANCYHEAGSISRSNEVYFALLKVYDSSTTEGRRGIVDSTAQLAANFFEQEQYVVSEQHQREVVRLRELYFPEEKSELASSYHALAITHLNTGDVDAAQICLSKAFKFKSLLDSKAVEDTLAMMERVALRLRDLGFLRRALEMMKEVQHERLAYLGAEHRDTLKAAAWIALLQKETGDVDRGMDMLLRSFHEQLRILGPNDEDTKWTLQLINGQAA